MKTTVLETKKTANGLDEISVADTILSHVDGEKGQLIIGGYEVEDLSLNAHFEDLLHLFDTGALPTQEASKRLKGRLYLARLTAFRQIPNLTYSLELSDAMDSLRGTMAQVDLDLFRNQDIPENLALIGASSVFSAAWYRRQKHLPLVEPSERSHAADYLRMIIGTREPQTNLSVDFRKSDTVGGDSDFAHRARALESYMVTVSDHGLNASTFTARVIASTDSDMVSSIVGAIGALKGPLHGGAPGPVLDMLDEIGDEKNARTWLEKAVGDGDRIMGMGHRIYKVRDPRAAALEKTLQRLENELKNISAFADESGSDRSNNRLKLAHTVEREAETVLELHKPGRRLKANVEFYTAVLLESVGIDRSMFSAVFACARIAGWCAHVAEQRRTGRLIRPASNYVGKVGLTLT